MLRKLMIGLDGSPYAQAGVELGIRWARRYGATLVGLGIVDEPEIRRGQMVPIGGAYFKELADERRLARAREKVAEFLETFAERCREYQVPYEIRSLEGSPDEHILAEAQRYDAVVLGHETHFAFATQEHADHTLQDVLRDSPRPIVVMPERLPVDEAIVVAYDGSLQAARALYAFVACGLHRDRPVHVVAFDDDRETGRIKVERAVDFLTAHGVSPQIHVEATEKPVAQALIDKAQALSAECIVMGCYGQPAVREFFLGSVTRTLLRETPVPLFLHH